jgi:cell division protein FtsB
MRESYEARIATLERENVMRKAEIKQLQDLFATQTVMRGSGPTA